VASRALVTLDSVRMRTYAASISTVTLSDARGLGERSPSRLVMIGVGFVTLTAECAQNLVMCAAAVRRFAGSPIQGCIG
jgi:hypothetical protein